MPCVRLFILAHYRRAHPSSCTSCSLARRLNPRTHQARAEPTRPQATPGASDFIARLLSEGHGVAIATGGWTASARLKLECCGIEHKSIPSAFACDAHPRAEIIEIARKRAHEQGIHDADDPAVVYIGDGLWDLTAARHLGIGFVGLATGQREVLLRESGANDVFGDFLDQEAFLEALRVSMT